MVSSLRSSLYRPLPHDERGVARPQNQLKKATDRLLSGEIVMGTKSEEQSYGKRIRNSSGCQWVYPENEAAYWREQHSKQPYAKNYSYEQFEHAYRTGYDTFLKYPGERFDEVEQSVANEYQQAKPESALPWDTVRPAINAVWDRLGGVIGPRDVDRGMRDSI